MKVEIVTADHQNKPDIGAKIARQWFDVDHVDVIVDVPNSGVALAVNEVAREKNKVFLVSGAATSDLTGPKCSPNTVHWTYDTWMLANGTGKARGEDRRRYLVLPHRRLRLRPCARARHHRGRAGQWRQGARQRQRIRSTTAISRRSCCRRRPSKAKIIGLANAGGDTVNAIKQAPNSASQPAASSSPACWSSSPTSKALGLKTAQGLVLTETCYWDMNDANRAWTKRWQAEQAGKIPDHESRPASMRPSLHYLKAVAALKSAADGKAVVAKMKEMPTDDPLFGKGTIRADGRKIHPAYLFEVKKPEESKYPGDYYKLRATIPADEAFRPLKDGNCPLVSG